MARLWARHTPVFTETAKPSLSNQRYMAAYGLWFSHTRYLGQAPMG